MKREDYIEMLHDSIEHNKILTYEELKAECEPYRLDASEVLSDMGWNSCDRCGILADTELDLVWLEYWSGWEEEEQAVKAAMARENSEYTAICSKCFTTLKAKGTKLIEWRNNYWQTVLDTAKGNGVGYIETGLELDGRKICLVIGWVSGYDKGEDFQKEVGGELYTLCGKLAYNCDDLACDYEHDWYELITKRGVYGTETPIGNDDWQGWLSMIDDLRDDLYERKLMLNE